MRIVVLLAIVMVISVIVTYRKEIMPTFLSVLEWVRLAMTLIISSTIGRRTSRNDLGAFSLKHHIHNCDSMLSTWRLDNHKFWVPLSLGIRLYIE